MTATAARFNKDGSMDIFNVKKQRFEHRTPMKKLKFEVNFLYSLECEELVRKIINCLNTSTSRVKEIK